MEGIVGKRMYRGLLKTVARMWNPKDIQDPEIQQRVLVHMQAANRRAETARQKVGLTAYAAILGSLKLRSLDQVDNLKTLREVVVALEAAATRAR
jgi:hypothetical protein